MKHVDEVIMVGWALSLLPGKADIFLFWDMCATLKIVSVSNAIQNF